MYEYQYVQVEYRSGFARMSLDEHREIIDRRAGEGWRFVAAIPTRSIGYGNVSRLDLVFEKEKPCAETGRG